MIFVMGFILFFLGIIGSNTIYYDLRDKIFSICTKLGFFLMTISIVLYLGSMLP